MIVHVIHSKSRTDRWGLLQNEIQQQHLEVRMWDIIPAENPKKSIHASHKQVIQYAKDNGLEDVIIIQDDIKFLFPNAFDYFIEHKPSDFDLWLGGVSWCDFVKGNTVGDFSGLHLVCIHNRFYDKFLAANDKMNLDRSLSGKGKFVVVDPFVAIQHNTFSDMQKRFVNLDKYWDKEKLYRPDGM